MIRWGILGAGKIAHRFCASLQKLPDCTLQAIAGRNKEKMEAFQKQFPCQSVYTDFNALIEDDNVDAIYLALPHAMHAEWAVKALQNHKAVLSEKPAVLNTQEMKDIAKAARENHVLYMEGMKTRMEPANRKLKEEIDKIGKIQKIETSIFFELPKEMIGKSYLTSGKGSGCLLDSGCYCTQWAEDFLMGTPVVKKTYANVYNGIDFYVKSLLQFDNAEFVIENGIDRSGEARAVIHGEKGTVTVTPVHRPESFTIKTADGEETISVPYEYDDFYGEIRHFCDLLNHHETESPIMSLDDSIRNAEILDAVRSSFTEYDEKDLKTLEEQEKTFAMSSFTSKDALAIGNAMVSLLPEYDRGIVVQIIRESDQNVIFQYITDDKTEKNIMYTTGKHACISQFGHSSAWVFVLGKLKPLSEGTAASGGAFPIFNQEGKLIASILVSGLHEGKDHELILRALKKVYHKDYPDLIKALG